MSDRLNGEPRAELRSGRRLDAGSIQGRILVADAGGQLRDNLEPLLLYSGFEIASAVNLEQTHHELSHKSCDLVLCDLEAAGADGLDLLAWTAEHAPDSLVMLISSRASPDSTIRALRMGAFDYLVKPVDLELLSISIERALHRIEADRERERAEEELARWSAQLTVINDIGKRAATLLDETELLRMVTRSVHREFGYYHVYFAMLGSGEAELRIAAQAGAYEGVMPEGHAFGCDTGISGRVAVTGRKLLANDVSQSRDYYELMPATRSQVALPLKVDGRTVGVLSVESATRDAFDERDVMLLETLAEQVASSIKTSRLVDRIRATNIFLDAVVNSSADAIVTTDVHGLITSFSPGARNIYGYTDADVLGKPVADYYAGGQEEAERLQRLLASHERIKNYETVILARDGRRVHASVSASLLRDATGRVLGTLGVSKDISRRVELEHKLKELTITDSLTGLYNQRHLYRKVHAEIERARRQKRALTVALFDLDRFKQYNDTHGHLEGDKLLREVGRLVQYSIRANVDAGFRYGGDEFVVLLPEIDADSVELVTGRIKSTIERGLDHEVSLSMGAAVLGPETDAESFIRAADTAMYEAKRAGGAQVVVRVAG